METNTINSLPLLNIIIIIIGTIINIIIVITNFMMVRNTNKQILHEISHSRKEVYVNAITTARLKWIDNMRQRIYEFIQIYSKEKYLKPDKRETLKTKKFEIDLFLNYKNPYPDYDKINKVLINMLNSAPENPVTDYQELVEKSQLLLGNSYKRAKKEAEIDDELERKYYEEIYKSNLT